MIRSEHQEIDSPYRGFLTLTRYEVSRPSERHPQGELGNTS
jgi:hypothetical protein